MKRFVQTFDWSCICTHSYTESHIVMTPKRLQTGTLVSHFSLHTVSFPSTSSCSCRISKAGHNHYIIIFALTQEISKERRRKQEGRRTASVLGRIVGRRDKFNAVICGTRSTLVTTFSAVAILSKCRK